MRYRLVTIPRSIRRLAPPAPARWSERAALTVGLLGLVFGSVLTAAAALSPTPVPGRAALSALAAGRPICPDGWAAAEAARAGVAEAEIMASYVADVLLAPDDAILRRAARHLARGGDARPDADARIALCVAASRGLIERRPAAS